MLPTFTATLFITSSLLSIVNGRIISTPDQVMQQMNELWMKATSKFQKMSGKQLKLISFMEHRIGQTIGDPKRPAVLSVLSHEIGVTEGPQPLMSILSHRVGNTGSKDGPSLLSVLAHQVGERSHAKDGNQPLLSVLSHFVG